MTDPGRLATAFAREQPRQFATVVAGADPGAIRDLVTALEPDAAAAVLVHLPATRTADVITELGDEDVARRVAAAPLDVAVRLLGRVPEQRRNLVLASIRDASSRRRLERLVLYPRRTVGALMESDVAAVGVGDTVGEVVEWLRRNGAAAEPLVCIVDDASRLRGVVDLTRLVTAETGTAIGACLVPAVPLRAETPIAMALDSPAWLTHTQTPVTGHRGRLLGAVSRRALIDALEAEKGVADMGAVAAALELGARFLEVLSELAVMTLGRRDPR